jgi:hypothetical protein
MKGSLRAKVFLAATSLMLGQGCGDTPYVDASRTEATVTGVVKVKGQPATGGEISFNPSNRDRKVGAFTAPIGKDGTYAIKTYTGENEVRFMGDVNTAYPMIGMLKKFCEVTGGGQQQDFDLLADDDSGGGSYKTKMMTKGAANAGARRGGRSM